MIVTRQELATVLGVSLKTISAWTADGMPLAVRNGSGRANNYDLKTVIVWYTAHEIEKAMADGEGGPGGDGLTAARKKNLEVKTAREEEKLKKELAQVIPADLVLAEWSSILMELRQSCLDIPARLGPALTRLTDRIEIEELIRTEIYTVLTALSREPDYQAPTDDDEPDDDDADA